MSIKGFYQLTWGTPNEVPGGADLSVSFSGWADFEQALNESNARRSLIFMFYLK
jgi:hypothetical protein